MIESFRDRDTQEVFLRGANRRWNHILRTAVKKLDMIHVAKTLKDLKAPPNNRLERLQGNRAGQHSIRINDQYRVCFTWEEGRAYDVEITDYH